MCARTDELRLAPFIRTDELRLARVYPSLRAPGHLISNSVNALSNPADARRTVFERVTPERLNFIGLTSFCKRRYRPEGRYQ